MNSATSGIKINGWYKLRLEQTFEVYQKYIWYILNAGGREGRFFTVFLVRFFKTTRETRPGKTGFRFGNKGYAIVRI